MGEEVGGVTFARADNDGMHCAITVAVPFWLSVCRVSITVLSHMPPCYIYYKRGASKRKKKIASYFFCLDYGCADGQFSLYVHFMTILNPVSLFSCAVHFWVELKAWN
jgi:hypothetical protein